jgi:hypothetical protein
LTARRYEPEKDAGWLRKWVHEFFMDVAGSRFDGYFGIPPLVFKKTHTLE